MSKTRNARGAEDAVGDEYECEYCGLRYSEEEYYDRETVCHCNHLIMLVVQLAESTAPERVPKAAPKRGRSKKDIASRALAGSEPSQGDATDEAAEKAAALAAAEAALMAAKYEFQWAQAAEQEAIIRAKRDDDVAQAERSYQLRRVRMTPQLRVVTDALARAESPAGVSELLFAMAADSLVDPPHARHPWQAQVVEWIGESIGDIDASLDKRAAELLAEKDDAERGVTLVTDFDNLNDELDKAVADLAAKKAEAVASQLRAEEALKDACAGREDWFAWWQQRQSASVLKHAMSENDSYLAWKLFKSAEPDELAEFFSIAKQHGHWEPGLLGTVWLVLAILPERRSDQEVEALLQFEAAVEQRLADLDENLLEDPMIAATDDAVKATKALVKEAASAEQRAQLDAEEARAAVEQAWDALDEHRLSIAEALERFNDAAAASSNFKLGPLDAFLHMKEHGFPKGQGVEDIFAEVEFDEGLLEGDFSDTDGSEEQEKTGEDTVEAEKKEGDDAVHAVAGVRLRGKRPVDNPHEEPAKHRRLRSKQDVGDATAPRAGSSLYKVVAYPHLGLPLKKGKVYSYDELRGKAGQFSTSIVDLLHEKLRDPNVFQPVAA